MEEVITAAELDEWEVRTHPDRPEGLDDPLWRLANLYRCLDPDAQDVPFIPTEEQRTVLICIFIRGWLRVIIPKARQLGMSLLLCLITLDGIVFADGFKASWIDKTAPDAELKLKEKIKFAWDRLDPAIRGTLKVETSNNSELSFRRNEMLPGETPAPSGVKAGINYRGGTVQLMVISEWGWVQAFDRARSAEIKNGALPAAERAEDGLVVIETTWEGGLDGEVGPLVLESMETPADRRGPKTWRVLFFGWQTNPSYAQTHGYIDEVSRLYFEKDLEPRGIHLTTEQKYFYAEKRRTMLRVKAEYPTFVEECWASVVEGAVYGEEMVTARNSGRIVNFLHDERYPVHTFWDLGMPINTVCWYCQITPTEIRVIDVDMEMPATLQQRAARMREKGYSYGFHYLPWEADQDHTAGSTRAVIAAALGGNIKIVPKIALVAHRIDAMRTHFPRFVFHAERCKVGVEHLQRYRYERSSATGITKLHPVHDKYSHAADALGQMAQAIEAGLVPKGGSVGGIVDRPAGRPMVKRAGQWS